MLFGFFSTRVCNWLSCWWNCSIVDLTLAFSLMSSWVLKASMAILGQQLGGTAVAFIKEGREDSTCLELKYLYHDRDTIWSAICIFLSETTENESNVFWGTDEDMQYFISLFWFQQTATSRYQCWWYISHVPSILLVLSWWKLHAGSPLLPHLEAPAFF